jgi:hypothetical protein
MISDDYGKIRRRAYSPLPRFRLAAIQNVCSTIVGTGRTPADRHYLPDARGRLLTSHPASEYVKPRISVLVERSIFRYNTFKK